MKKTLAVYLLFGVIYPSNLRAFELASVFESNLADNVLKGVAHFQNRMIQEGTINTFVNFNQHQSTLGLLQIGTPLHDKMVGKYHLLRFEISFLENYKHNVLQPNRFELLKLGFSGRHMIKPNFILGWYLLNDGVSQKNHSEEIPRLINGGLEAIWPRSVTIIVDTVFALQNLINDDAPAGKISIKGGILKPQKLDIFMAVSCTKYPSFPREWKWTFFGIKLPIPIQKWNIHQRWTAGANLTYKKTHSWLNPKNIGWSIYLQGNWMKPIRQNPLKEYLRMPIDRSVATPYHPGESPAQ